MVSYTIGGIYGHSTILHEANDLVVVRYKTATYEIPKTSSDMNKDLSDRVLPINVFPEANVVVYRCLPSMRMTEEQTRNELRSRFKKSNKIKFVGRTLIDEYGTIRFGYVADMALAYLPSSSAVCALNGHLFLSC